MADLKDVLCVACGEPTGDARERFHVGCCEHPEAQIVKLGGSSWLCADCGADVIPTDNGWEVI